MPSIGTQIKSYMSHVEKVHTATKAEREATEQLLEQVKANTASKKQLLKEGLAITIGFCTGTHRTQLRRPFVAWYDYSTGCRVVLDYSTNYKCFSLIPWHHWKLRWTVAHQFDTEVDLRPGMNALRQIVEDTRNYTLAVLKMLQASGLGTELSDDISVDDLFTFIIVGSGQFEPADPATYLEDITDEE
jgi:hypothetical protein